MSVINLGDVPTWLAVTVGATGGGIALGQLRQQGKVIRGEFERNKKRDELLDGQLRDLGQRTRLIRAPAGRAGGAHAEDGSRAHEHDE